jgi:carboxylesterase type B
VIIADLLLAKDGSMDLFDRAFLQSGGILPVLDTPSTMNFVYQDVLIRTGCADESDKLQCLRTISARTLLNAQINGIQVLDSPLRTSFGPLLDGVLLTRQHRDSLKLGLFRKIPLMYIRLTQDKYKPGRGQFFCSCRTFFWKMATG